MGAALREGVGVMITDVPGVYQEWLPPTGRYNKSLREKLNLEAVIVVAYVPATKQHSQPALYRHHRRGLLEGITDVIACAWRVSADEKWLCEQSFFNSVYLRPHPDADKVWADYCAALLIESLSD